jgi:hypothetical protein
MSMSRGTFPQKVTKAGESPANIVMNIIIIRAADEAGSNSTKRVTIGSELMA